MLPTRFLPGWMLSRHLLVCSCRPRARTQQGSGPRSSPRWGQFAGLATGRVSKWLSRPCPRVWLCGFGVPEPHCSRGRWQGVNLGGAGACPPAWGGPCSGSAAAPLWSPRYCMYCSWTSPLQTPGGLPSPAPTTAPEPCPHYSSGGPCPAEAQEEAAAAVLHGGTGS